MIKKVLLPAEELANKEITFIGGEPNIYYLTSYVTKNVKRKK